MVLNFGHRVLLLSLALMMFFSSMSLAMDLHFCQGQLKNFSLFGTAQSCHEKALSQEQAHKNKSTCKHRLTSTLAVGSKDCCHNESVVIEGLDTNYNGSIGFYVDHDLTFPVGFSLNQSFQDQMLDLSGIKSFLLYKPPLPDKDFQSLFQSLLI